MPNITIELTAAQATRVQDTLDVASVEEAAAILKAHLRHLVTNQESSTKQAAGAVAAVATIAAEWDE